jgi:FG-GAP-like repeat
MRPSEQVDASAKADISQFRGHDFSLFQGEKTMISLTKQSNNTMMLVISAMLLAAGVAAAQPCNTGYEPATGNCGTLWSTYNPETGGTEVDAHWKLATPYPSSPSDPGTGTPAQQNLIKDPCSAKFGAAWVDYPDGQSPAPVVYGYWSTDGPTSNWISPRNEVNAHGGLYIYKTTFTAPSSWVSPVNIHGRIQSDNETYSIYGSSPAVTRCQHLAGPAYLGGSSFSAAPTINTPTGFLTWTVFGTGPFQIVPSQPATLYFIVRNRGVHGSDAAPTPTGLRIESGSFHTPSLTQAAGGDFNGDGQMDVAVADGGTNKVAVFLNSKGSFPKGTEYPVGKNPVFVAAGDLNGDGRPDLAVADAGSDAVSVLLNNGQGSFGKPLNYPAGIDPVAIAIGDVNGDGVLDMAVANANPGGISILLGAGGGKFQPAQGIMVGDPTESSPASLVLADLNGDGKLDVALADTGTGGVIVLLGNGDGTFGAPVAMATGAAAPTTMVAADLNGDGRMDLAMSDPGTQSVYIMLGNGDGTFQPAVSYPAGSNPQSLVLFYGGTAGLDLAVADPVTNSVDTLLGNGNGTFGIGPSYPAGPTPLSLVVLASPTGTSLAAVDNANSSIFIVPVQ